MQRINHHIVPRIHAVHDHTVTIRSLEEQDHDALLAFGHTLPQDDWLYLRHDLQDPRTVARLATAHAAENWRQIVAVVDDEVIGYANVRLLPGWSDHVGDIHLSVSHQWRRSGVGTALAKAIIDAAPGLGLAKVIVEVIEKQHAGRAIFERLGFQVEGLLHNHMRDHNGQTHNLLILAFYLARPATDDD
jgi:ribosomal protein S18 acetylase RimI-like enzyme